MRIIGLSHRVKMTVEGKPRPTELTIIEDEKSSRLSLKEEQDELEFVMGLREGDTVAMILGGSGDCLAYALARQAEQAGARVLRIPGFVLKKHAAEGREQHENLAVLAAERPDLFYEVTPRDRALILVREHWRALSEAMKARIACEQRLRQRFIGRAFTAKDGLFPEGGIEQAFDAEKASDIILLSLEKEERQRERELVKALHELDIYVKLFEPIEGVGPRIAARIISAIGDIRQFETKHKLKAFMGAHVLKDGTFPRRRRKQIANWHTDARQALYLLGDQFVKRPNSRWGQYQRKMKAGLRERHPVPVKEANSQGTMVTRYSDGHIHKMATWRTISRFVERLHKDWTRLEKEQAARELRKAA